MWNQKRMALTLAAVLTTVSITACSGNNNNNSNNNGNGKNTSTTEGSKETTQPVAAVPNLNETGFPIVNEAISLKVFTGKSATNGNKFEETLIWKEYAKMTNINAEFELVPFENLTNQRNLVLASGEYPDVFYTARMLSDELSKYGKQGVLVPLNDMLEKYAPNISAILEKYPNIKSGLTMPDGNIYSLPTLYDPEALSILIGAPIWINTKWLEELGMKEPTTIDEYYEYLKAVKNTDLNDNGKSDEIPLAGGSIDAVLNQLKGSWGLGTVGLGHQYVDLDPNTNELRFIRTTDTYKEFLQFMNKLYTEGLIDQEIFTIKSTALYAKGQEGILGSVTSPNPKTIMGQEGYVGLGALTGPHGDKLYSHVKSPLPWVGAFAMTTANEHPEATLRWIDYFYGEEGSKFFFLGQKDVTYMENADGTVQYVDEIANNSQGLTQDQAAAKYFTWLGGSYPAFVRIATFLGSESKPEALEAAEKARPDAVKNIWTAFNFTDDEASFMASTGQDIVTYIKEMEAKFINGTESFSEWESYVKTLDKMGKDEYMKVYQAAYDRYKGN